MSYIIPAGQPGSCSTATREAILNLLETYILSRLRHTIYLAVCCPFSLDTLFLTRLYLNVKHFKTSFVKCRLEELYLVDILKSDTLNISGGHNSVSAFSQPTVPGLESMPVRGEVWAGAGEWRGDLKVSRRFRGTH